MHAREHMRGRFGVPTLGSIRSPGQQTSESLREKLAKITFLPANAGSLYPGALILPYQLLGSAFVAFSGRAFGDRPDSPSFIVPSVLLTLSITGTFVFEESRANCRLHNCPEVLPELVPVQLCLIPADDTAGLGRRRDPR